VHSHKKRCTACLLHLAFQRWPGPLAALGPLDLALAAQQGSPAEVNAWLSMRIMALRVAG
jgi:hypothetical protein